jgi:hypothetical protein
MKTKKWILIPILTVCALLFVGCTTTIGDKSDSFGNGGGETAPVTPLSIEITPEGTVLHGTRLGLKLAWLDRNIESHGIYILDISANDNIDSYTFQYSGAINVTVIFRGDGTNRTIRLSKSGTMFDIRTNVTFILDNNVTLQGHSQNTSSMIYVNGGIFIMNEGATITGNDNVGVIVGEQYGNSGTFTMNGGVISDNSSSGIWLRKGDFAMNSGIVSGNSGSGVNLDNGTFSMTNGTISGNSGPGVYINSGTFSMTDGIISNNTANRGGGVHLNSGTFNMRGGTITGNTAIEYGGGVYRNNGTFTKTGGIITGYSNDPTNGNVVKDGAGPIPRRGHAVYVSTNVRKETTAGQEDNLSANGSTATGGWDE